MTEENIGGGDPECEENAGGTRVPGKVASFSKMKVCDAKKSANWKKEEPAAAACDVKFASFPFRPARFSSVERVRMFLSTFSPSQGGASCSFCF